MMRKLKRKGLSSMFLLAICVVCFCLLLCYVIKVSLLGRYLREVQLGAGMERSGSMSQVHGSSESGWVGRLGMMTVASCIYFDTRFGFLERRGCGFDRLSALRMVVPRLMLKVMVSGFVLRCSMLS